MKVGTSVVFKISKLRLLAFSSTRHGLKVSGCAHMSSLAYCEKGSGPHYESLLFTFLSGTLFVDVAGHQDLRFTRKYWTQTPTSTKRIRSIHYSLQNRLPSYSWTTIAMDTKKEKWSARRMVTFYFQQRKWRNDGINKKATDRTNLDLPSWHGMNPSSSCQPMYLPST